MQILRDTQIAVPDLQDDLEVVAQVALGDAVVPAALAARPDVAIVDIELPGMDGLAAAAPLRERLPECRVLVLTAGGARQPAPRAGAIATRIAADTARRPPLSRDVRTS
jgi:two-component system response regulator DesR